jgi:hypothetical protein
VIESVQVTTSVVDGELPADGGALLVAGGVPGGDLGDERVAVADAAVEARASQHGELPLGHVEPTAVDRGEVELERPQDASGVARGERLVEGGRGVGVRVIEDDPDGGRVGEVAVDVSRGGVLEPAGYL